MPFTRWLTNLPPIKYCTSYFYVSNFFPVSGRWVESFGGFPVPIPVNLAVPCINTGFREQNDKQELQINAHMCEWWNSIIQMIFLLKLNKLVKRHHTTTSTVVGWTVLWTLALLRNFNCPLAYFGTYESPPTSLPIYYIHIHIYTYTHTYLYIYIHICTYIYDECHEHWKLLFSTTYTRLNTL